MTFTRTHDVIKSPHAPGAYRPEAFTNSNEGEQIKWGVHIGKQKKSLPFIERFDFKTPHVTPETTPPVQDQTVDEPKGKSNKNKQQSTDDTDNSAKNESLASESELYNRKREAFANPKVDNPDLPNVLSLIHI